MILLEIRGKSIAYAANKKKADNIREEKLISEIGKLENHLTEKNMETLENKRRELEALRKTKVDGMIIRSRAKWIEEGKKNTKYFSSLEKRNYIEKCMTHLEKENGNVISDPTEIREEAKVFYQNLYASREADLVDVDLASTVEGPKLTDELRESVEGLITYEEALRALKHMKNNKSPGSDGFTTEFF